LSAVADPEATDAFALAVAFVFVVDALAFAAGFAADVPAAVVWAQSPALRNKPHIRNIKVLDTFMKKLP
jgi:hypothetical protein